MQGACKEVAMTIAAIETGLCRIALPVPLSDSTHGTMTHFELVHRTRMT